MTFLCISSLEVNMENLKLMVSLHFAIECNSFGMSTSERLRCGTAVFFPTSLINHSCEPNAFIKFAGNKQYLLANQEIQEGEEITISYIDHAYPERIYRQRLLRDGYFFDCICERCQKEKDVKTDVVLYSIAESGSELENLNQESLDMEKQGKYHSALEIVHLMLKMVEN